MATQTTESRPSTPAPSAEPAKEATTLPVDTTAKSEFAARLAQGEAIVRKNVFWALGAGVVPIPILDIAAVMAVELKLLRELSDVYQVKFSEGIGKKIVYSLLSSVGLVGIGGMVGGSLAKFIPAIGTTLGFISVPVLTGAFTHAMGRVLLVHFEAGGTLLDLDVAAMRLHFKEEFGKAKTTVAQMRSEADPPGAKAS